MPMFVSNEIDLSDVEIDGFKKCVLYSCSAFVFIDTDEKHFGQCDLDDLDNTDILLSVSDMHKLLKDPSLARSFIDGDESSKADVLPVDERVSSLNKLFVDNVKLGSHGLIMYAKFLMESAVAGTDFNVVEDYTGVGIFSPTGHSLIVAAYSENKITLQTHFKEKHIVEEIEGCIDMFRVCILELADV